MYAFVTPSSVARSAMVTLLLCILPINLPVHFSTKYFSPFWQKVVAKVNYKCYYVVVENSIHQAQARQCLGSGLCYLLLT